MDKLKNPHARILFVISDLAKSGHITPQQKGELKSMLTNQDPIFQTVIEAAQNTGEQAFQIIQSQIKKVLESQAPYAHQIQDGLNKEADSIVGRHGMAATAISQQEKQDPFDSPQDARLMMKKRKKNQAMKEEAKIMEQQHVGNIKECDQGPSPVATKKTMKEMLAGSSSSSKPASRSPLGSFAKKFGD